MPGLAYKRGQRRRPVSALFPEAFLKASDRSAHPRHDLSELFDTETHLDNGTTTSTIELLVIGDDPESTDLDEDHMAALLPET